MPNPNVGGRVDIRIGNEVWHPVAEVKIKESPFEAEVVDNQDGSIGRSIKSTHFEVDLTFRSYEGLDPRRLFEGTFDFSMVERDRGGRSILLTNAFTVGQPERNTVNGEISGCKIVSSQYQVI